MTNNSSIVNTYNDVAGEGRYIRIYGTARATPYGYSIYELEVYGEAASSEPVVNAGDNVTLAFPSSEVTLEGEATSDRTITQYAWTVMSGPNVPTLVGANTATLTAKGLIEGFYVFRLTVTDDQGVSAFDDVSVVVETVTDVEQDQAGKIQLYPNPSGKYLYIDGVRDGSIVFVSSTMGTRVGEKIVFKSSIDVSELPSGLYRPHSNGVLKKFIKE